MVSSDRLTSSQLLEIRDRGMKGPTSERALAILACACSLSREAILDLPLGRREHLLWGLRRDTFGNDLQAVVDCPHCGERNQIGCQVDAILGAPAPETPTAFHRFQHGDWDLSYRPPTTRDLLAAKSDPSHLVRSLLIDARNEHTPWKPEADVPAVLLDALDHALAEHNPLVDIQFSVACASCQQLWNEPFSIADFLWEEIAAEARRILRDIHQIALAYGWDESTILALSPERRRAYMEMIEA